MGVGWGEGGWVRLRVILRRESGLITYLSVMQSKGGGEIGGISKQQELGMPWGGGGGGRSGV